VTFEASVEGGGLFTEMSNRHISFCAAPILRPDLLPLLKGNLVFYSKPIQKMESCRVPDAQPISKTQDHLLEAALRRRQINELPHPLLPDASGENYLLVERRVRNPVYGDFFLVKMVRQRFTEVTALLGRQGLLPSD
jgi:hypothetical protein